MTKEEFIIAIHNLSDKDFRFLFCVLMQPKARVLNENVLRHQGQLQAAQRILQTINIEQILDFLNDGEFCFDSQLICHIAGVPYAFDESNHKSNDVL